MSVARVPEAEIRTRIYRVADLESLRRVREFGVELIDGEVFVTPSPTPGHQSIAGELYVVLHRAVQTPGLGRVFMAPLDVVLDDRTAVMPDIVVVLADRLAVIGSERIHGVPSLVVEVVSPSSRRTDGFEKRNRYARAAVPEYWLLDPAGGTTVRYSAPADGVYTEVLMLNRDETLHSATIPGLRVDLTTIFRNIGPT